MLLSLSLHFTSHARLVLPSRCWPAPPSTKQVTPQLWPWAQHCSPLGGARKMWIPNPPPHRIPQQNENRSLSEHCPVVIASSESRHQSPPRLSTRFCRKYSGETSAHPHGLVTQGGRCHSAVQSLRPSRPRPCVAGLQPFGGRAPACFCLANGVGNKTKQNKTVTCRVMTKQGTCLRGRKWQLYCCSDYKNKAN